MNMLPDTAAKAPMPLLEARLLSILASVLERPLTALSAQATLSEQGVDSLLGLRFARGISDALGIEIDGEWLFDYPSVKQLAGFLEEQGLGKTLPAP